jgi:beta-N-acetylhexosaminidase
MVNLHEKPFYLNEKQIEWVNETIGSMTLEEKIGQLFVNLFTLDLSKEDIRTMLKKYPVGGARYQGGKSPQIHDYLATLQSESKIPLLIAANCDAGGNGAMMDGTYVASAAQVEASGSEDVGYDVGYVSGKESEAIGINWNFGPNVDILTNWRNTIVNTRAYGTDADSVIKYSKAYARGLKQSQVLACMKHFPGDGTEERDQHLILGVNELLPNDWDASFGKVYRALIDEGIPSIMAGHIALPHYQTKLNPNLKYEDILPATLSKELLTDLLRDQLGFNGLIITDASHMIGMAAAMKRRDYVPAAIAAGCDMFLFFNDMEEDFNFMLDGYRNGVITPQRLEDALSRILGLKAALNLHEKQKQGTLIPDKANLSIVGCAEHLDKARNAADLGITLVKDTWKQLPIRPETHPRVHLHTLYGEISGITHGSKASEAIIIEELERVGFKVTLNDGTVREKGKTSQLSKDYDVALEFADIVGYAAENNYRIRWKVPMSNDIPWFVYEVPTIFISLNYTTHLIDVPMVKTYINGYGNTRIIIREIIRKLMGDTEFKGQPNDLVWCGNLWEAKR